MVRNALKFLGTEASARVVRPNPETEPVRASTRPARSPKDSRTVFEHAVEQGRAAGASPTLAVSMAMDALDLLGLKDSAGTQFESLSEGERERVMVARTLMTDRSLSADEVSEARAALERLVSLGA